MFSFIANAVTKKMVSNKIIDNDKFDIYTYGFEMLFAYASLFLIILLISILTNSLIESMLFLIGFYVLRKYVRGFHASTYLKCQLNGLVEIYEKRIDATKIKQANFNI